MVLVIFLLLSPVTRLAEFGIILFAKAVIEAEAIWLSLVDERKRLRAAARLKRIQAGKAPRRYIPIWAARCGFVLLIFVPGLFVGILGGNPGISEERIVPRIVTKIVVCKRLKKEPGKCLVVPLVGPKKKGR